MIRSTIAAVFVLCAISLTACNSQPPSSPTRNARATSTDQPRDAIAAVTLETTPSEPNPTPSPPTSASKTAVANGEAPSYEAIERSVFSILYSKEHPRGPHMGPDGIADAKVNEQLDGLFATLRGKKVELWTGCASYVEQSPVAGGGYTLAVSMHGPKPRNESPFDVELFFLSADQVQSLGLETPASESACHSVDFSGTIDRISSFGQISLTAVTLRRTR